MQFREQGKKVQCIRATYNKEKKAMETKLVATFDKWQKQPPAEVWAALITDADKGIDEPAQLRTWLDKRATEATQAHARYVAGQAVYNINEITTVAQQMTPAQAEAALEAIAQLQKALKKSLKDAAKKNALQEAPNQDQQESA